MSSVNRYNQIIEKIFFNHYQTNDREVRFERVEIEDVAKQLGIELPKNLGDLIYSFKFRASLPKSIIQTAPDNHVWSLRSVGRSQYCFQCILDRPIVPNPSLSQTKIPEATPEIIAKHALTDEQALLAKVRYNRLIDIFTGVTCYSLQNHLRTTVPEFGQIETDEIYVGVDRRGVQYVFPVQAKGGNDKLNIVQIEQDFALARAKFPHLICKAIAVQFMDDNVIALFSFEETDTGTSQYDEKHYRLVKHLEISIKDLENYQARMEI